MHQRQLLWTNLVEIACITFLLPAASDTSIPLPSFQLGWQDHLYPSGIFFSLLSLSPAAWSLSHAALSNTQALPLQQHPPALLSQAETVKIQQNLSKAQFEPFRPLQSLNILRDCHRTKTEPNLLPPAGIRAELWGNDGVGMMP